MLAKEQQRCAEANGATMRKTMQTTERESQFPEYPVSPLAKAIHERQSVRMPPIGMFANDNIYLVQSMFGYT